MAFLVFIKIYKYKPACSVQRLNGGFMLESYFLVFVTADKLTTNSLNKTKEFMFCLLLL